MSPVSVSREEVLHALRGVPEPCSIAMRTPMDITEMGLIEEVVVDGKDVRIVLVLTDPSCVHFNAMRSFIGDVVGALEGVDSVEVRMSTSMLWTPDRVRRRETAASA